MELNKAKKKEQVDNPMPYALCAAHGGNIFKIAEELGVSADSLIDFSASINPLGVSQRVKDVIKNELDSLVNYPDIDSRTLRVKLAEHHDIDSESIICGNGSTELIYLIPRALKPESVLIPVPTFSEYEKAGRISYELRVTSYGLKEEENFTINLDAFIAAMRDSLLVTRHSSLVTGRSAAFLCNPNNPTGQLLPKESVLEIAEAARGMKCYLVVDEAFIDFCPEESVVRHVQDNPYLIVLRSMTKFHSLTGLRIGYGVFHSDVIPRIKEFKEPWTVNHLAQKTAIVALDDEEYSRQTFELMAKEKAFMEEGFREMGVRFYPSAVNYYLLKIDVQLAVPMLRDKGILVRDCSNFKGLDGSFVRVAVKSREHNEVLLKELGVIPAQAGIQKKELDSGLRTAGMTE